MVANSLNERGLATLLFDLLTAEEEEEDAITRHLRFDIPLLVERTIGATDWLSDQELAKPLHLGYFGSSTGAAAALVAAAARPKLVNAVVSRGGRPDLAVDTLKQVRAPTLLIVGDRDYQVLDLNRSAMAMLSCEAKLATIAGATHLFEEPGTLEEVTKQAGKWFHEHLT